ncbi:hypothetical protein GGI43DRAFT_424295 [Trichoderma evansii]
MSPHVLVQAERHEEPKKLGTLTASLFFCFICLSIFTLGSLFVTYLERYKRQIVRILLSPFGTPDEEDGLQLRQDLFLNKQLNEKDLCQLDHQSNPFSPPLPSDNHDYKHSFTMSESKFSMDPNDQVLLNVQVTMGCNGLRDLYNVGFMRQDTLEKRIDGAINQLSIVNIVSICAIWFREKICRNTFSGTSPSIQDLCVFLQRRGCSQDMCCQIFYTAFHRLRPHLANQVSLRVSGETLTDFRSIVDYIYDHWYRWVEDAQVAADHAALLAAAKDPLPPTYPAYNHNLQSMPKGKYQKHVKESFSKLHRHQNHHYYHDSIKVEVGPAPLHEEHQPGDYAPYDLGQASTWGSAPDQAERCRTRSDDCVCKQCSITGWLPLVINPPDGAPLADTFLALSPTVSDSVDLLGLFDEVATVPREKKKTTNSNQLVPGPEYVCPNCGQQGDHYNFFCTGNRKSADFIYGQDNKKKAEINDEMHMDPRRAALMATGNMYADELLPSQVLPTQLEADDKSSSDLIMLNSGSETEDDRVGKEGKEGIGAKSLVFSYDLISIDSDDECDGGDGGGDDDCVTEVDRFLTTFDEKKAQDGCRRTSTSQQEARKKQKLDEAYEEVYVEPSLLDGLLEMEEGEYIEPGLTPCPQTPQPQLQPQDKSDIQFGVTDKPLGRDPPYDPAVHELLHNQDNTWIQMANRPTALEMWDAMYLDECHYVSSESEYDPY